jgi:hypothetical protein
LKGENKIEKKTKRWREDDEIVLRGEDGRGGGWSR